MKKVLSALLVLFLAAAAAADSHHPNLVKSELVTLDVAAIERFANDGTPFDLALGEVKLTVALEPSPVWPEEGLTVLDVEKDGSVQQRIVKGNITYAGEVVGEDPETSEARLTISGGVLEGYVMSSSGWWFLEPLAKFNPKAAAGEYLVYAAHDVQIAAEYGDDGVKTDVVVDTFPPNPPTRIPLVMVADFDYLSLPSQFPYEARHASLIHMVNGIYWGQTSRIFRHQVSIADFGRTYLTSTAARTLKCQLKAFVNFAGGTPCEAALPHCPTEVGCSGSGTGSIAGLRTLNAYLAHLTTAKDITGAANQDTAGIADLNGRYGVSEQGDTTPALNFQNMMLAAHEMGHNFGADHPGADCVCADGSTTCGNACRNTIMAAVFDDTNLPIFSFGVPDPAKNNRKVIRDFMSAIGF